MARIKIDYGIDLGTTNSAVCRMEKGEPVIIKSDTLKDTVPSCVSFNKKKSVKVGDGAYNVMKSDKRRATKSWSKESTNTFIEFKRTMATDTIYESSNMQRSFSSEELSSEVLKTLKSFITDENIQSAVITVPAKFTVNQKTATLEAGKLAGINHCELLQEPIAAAMAYGLNSNEKNGIWMVFDFGGGTFDAALLKVEDGIMQVFDTEGDNYLGGKNLDYAIVDNIIMPYLQENYSIDSILADKEKKEVLRDAMKTYAEEAKNQLSFKDHEDIISNLGDLGEDEDGEEIELDITVSQEKVFEVMRPYFQKAVDICKTLMARNKLSDNQISKLILVGGPTHSPLIREMLKEQVTPNVDTSIDPMTAVATGAALYASTIDNDLKEKDVETGTVVLEVGYESTSVENSEWVSIKLGESSPLDNVIVELTRNDKAWSSGKTDIDKTGNVVEANLVEGKPNSFTITAYDTKGNTLPCFPYEITIIQGTKVGAAPLPYNIGIAVWDDYKRRGVFRMAKGLEKNKPVPAIGVVNDLKTTDQLRPGVSEDKMVVPIYQTNDYSEAEGKTASLYNYVADVVITGDDIESLIPADSSVDLTLRVDSSEQMTLEAHFLTSDTTVEKALNTGIKQSSEDAREYVRKELDSAQRSINKLKDSNVETSKIQKELDIVKKDAENNTEHEAVKSHLQEVLRMIENVECDTEWPRVEKELREEFEKLEKAQNDLGNDKTAQLVNQIRQQTDQVIRTKDAKMGHDVLEQISALFISLTLVYQCMGFIRHYNSIFHSIQWKDASRARQLLNNGIENINNQPSVDVLHPIVCSLIELMPNDEAGNAGGMLR